MAGTYANLGALQVAQGRREEAEAAFRKAVEVGGDQPEPHLALANFLWQSGRLPEAEQSLQEALARDPKNAPANRAMATLLVATNRAADAGFDVGAVEASVESLIETDAEGRLRLSEQWPSERLGEAIARAYQRYAERLPPGPARVRAEAIARHVTASLGLTTTDGAFRAALVDDVRFRDHRPLGLSAVRGAATIRRGNIVMHEQVAGLRTRAEAVVALEPDWLLVHRTSRGVDRVGGGEIVFDQIHLWGFGPDGLIERGRVIGTGKPRPNRPGSWVAGRRACVRGW